MAVHVGTLGAVILYFRAEMAEAAAGIPNMLRGRMEARGARLATGLVIATIPVILAGLVLKLTGLDEKMRSIAVIGWTMIIFGIVLYWADQRGAETRRSQDWTLRHAWIMGLWQAVALIPGTSRSGITISAARWLGYAREDAARLSMLMSVPTILASAALLGLDVIRNPVQGQLLDGAIAALLAFVAALLALTLMMRLLRSVSFTPYVIYRVLLGIALLIYAYA